MKIPDSGSEQVKREAALDMARAFLQVSPNLICVSSGSGADAAKEISAFAEGLLKYAKEGAT